MPDELRLEPVADMSRTSGANEYYAHTLADHPPDDWQRLQDHLEGVAGRSEEFGRPFGADEWGRIAGLWHDLGKYSAKFQSYLLDVTSLDPREAGQTQRVDHSSAGAQRAVTDFGILGHLLSFPIAGHHSGLLDAISDGACIESRLKKRLEPLSGVPSSITSQSCPRPPFYLSDAIGKHDGFSVSFFVRMIFSSLVDADFLDTEAFLSSGTSANRPEWPEDVFRRLEDLLEAYVARLPLASREVNRQRSLVRDACLRAADQSPGFYSLTVPTGGGKTLSSLAFALRHALKNGMSRIIYVVPFTSIIEQNAGEFRKVTAALVNEGIPDPVVEHHSNLEPDRESTASRLAAENWDAPLVVTTGVQFYESLFASRTSRCRKLHNLAKSVIILDEAQCLPVDLLAPCLRALDELQRNYRATIVMCTATQPAVNRRDGFRIGLELPANREIIPDPQALYLELKRVTVERESEICDEDLAERMLNQPQVLCVVNTRGHARRMAELIGQAEGHFHLSALMCGAHRSEQIDAIKARLKHGSVCRVVSTRLIEAGVDIDFPVVYRSMAGLDSIAQAAGRCNRNGSLAAGRLIIFEPEDPSAESYLTDTADCARQVMTQYEDILSLDAIEHYFRLYYWDQSARWDSKQILSEFQLDQNPDLPFLFGFARAADRFRLIEERGHSVIVPWGSEGEHLSEALRQPWDVPPTRLLRKLQRYTVRISDKVWAEQGSSAFELVHDQYPVLAFPKAHYSTYYGLTLEKGISDLLIN